MCLVTLLDNLSANYHTRDMAKFIRRTNKITPKRQSKWGDLIAFRLAFEYIDFSGGSGLKTMFEILLVSKRWNQMFKRICWKKVLNYLEQDLDMDIENIASLGQDRFNTFRYWNERKNNEMIRNRAWINLLKIVKFTLFPLKNSNFLRTSVRTNISLKNKPNLSYLTKSTTSLTWTFREVSLTILNSISRCSSVF